MTGTPSRLIHGFNYANVNDMHDGMCRKLMLGTQRDKDYDWTYGTEVGLHNVMLASPSFDWQFDLKRLWLPRTRWTMMARQYIDPNALEDWKAKVEDRLVGKGRGIAVLRTKLVQGRGTGRGVRRRWGSCMLSFSYRTNPYPQVTLHSRTTYFGYLAAMDITVAHVLARIAGEIVGIEPEEMAFVWSLELAQFHGFRSLAWPLGDPELRGILDDNLDKRTSIKNPPGLRKALDGYERILKSDRAGKLYGDEAFSSFARVRRRFHTEAFGVEYADQFTGGSLNRGGKGAFEPLPSVDIEDLDFSGLRAKDVQGDVWDTDTEDDEDNDE